MEELIGSFLNAVESNYDTASSILQEFCKTNVTQFSFIHVEASLRNKFIRCLMEELSTEEEDTKGRPFKFIGKCLEALRILSRDSSNLGEMVTEDSCQLFLKLAGLYSDVDDNECRQLRMGIDTVVEKAIVVVEALKCVCNLVYQDAEFRQHTIKYNCTEGTCLRLMWCHYEQLPREVYFFDLRLLFVLTALEPSERTTALHSKALELLVAALDQVVPGAEIRHSLMAMELEMKESKSESTLAARCNLPELSLDKDVIELVGEILRVIFNITIVINQDHPEENVKISSDTLIFILYHLLTKCKQLPEEPKHLQNNIINTLINLPYQCYELLYWEIPKKDAKEIRKLFEANHNQNEHPSIYEFFNVEAIRVLLGILDQRLIENVSLKETLTPLLSVLTAVSRQNRIIRKYLREEVLPPLGYVGMEKPEDSKTTRGRLIQHLTSAVHDLKESVADFLFVLCKENVSRLVKYTGYGNAAGFLADHGLMAGSRPDDTTGAYSTDDEDSDTEDYERIKDKIDPMTGAQTDKTIENPLEKMSEEEKEQEAEKLVTLFEKLNEKGVVKPVGIGRDGKPKEIVSAADDT